MSNKITKVITVEEHYMSKKVNQLYNEILNQSDLSPAEVAKAKFIDSFVSKGEITEVGEKRIAFMDEHGIDIQILSYGNNSPMYLEKKHSIPLCKMANDELAYLCKLYPTRFYGFASLPVADIQESVLELERCVKKLGFKGVMFNGTYHNHFFDEKQFIPIFEKAAELQVPIMFHPGEVAQEVSSHYYQGDWPLTVTNVFAGHGIGWHYDSGIQYIRMILSGIFDKFPNLMFICGHWGEVLPYYFNRLDNTLTPEVTGLKYKISDYFKSNIFISPSGMFFEDNFEFCLNKMGADRILWATDYPYCKPENSKVYLEHFPISDADKEKVAHINAEKLFHI